MKSDVIVGSRGDININHSTTITSMRLEIEEVNSKRSGTLK